MSQLVNGDYKLLPIVGCSPTFIQQSVIEGWGLRSISSVKRTTDPEGGFAFNLSTSPFSPNILCRLKEMPVSCPR